MLRDRQFLTGLTSKCASRHNGVHFFQHHNFQKWSGTLSWLHFSLWNVLRATTAFTCLHFFDISTSNSGPELVCFVHFDFENVLRATTACNLSVSHLPGWLRTRRFSEPTCRPSGATKHRKNTVNRDFSTFSRTCIFFLLRFSLSWSSFFFLLFSDSSHLCFCICPCCRKFDF